MDCFIMAPSLECHSYIFFHNQGENNKRSLLNPLTPKSDWLLLSPHSITLESNVKVMRIKEMIINLRSS